MVRLPSAYLFRGADAVTFLRGVDLRARTTPPTNVASKARYVFCGRIVALRIHRHVDHLHVRRICA
jgi:hypothetical protein